MREIKFRAWDKSKKRFFQNRDEDVSWHIPTIAGINNMIPKYATITFFDTAQNFIYSQYTGLKDKKGVEIYEGDIVNHKIQGNREVIYPMSDTFACYGLRNSNGHVGTLQDSKALYTIVGNIYENKELLNG